MNDSGREGKRAEKSWLITIIKSACVTTLALLFAFSSIQLITCSQAEAAQKQQSIYVCPMHADVKSATSANCPKCTMALRVATSDSATSTSSDGAEKPGDKQDQVGVEIPDANVIDQDGQQLRFYTDLVKGKVVAINFIFTTCTTICPPLTAIFREVQQQLGDRLGRDVSLISVSVDPTTDVPERLSAFSAKFDRGDGWTFVTGAKREIDRLLRALGAYVGDKNDHTPMILIGNEKAGYWTRTYGLAPPAMLVKAITEAADKPAAVGQQAAERERPASPAEAAAR